MSEDLISRQAAINAINSWFEIAKHPMNRGAYNNGELAAYSTAISEIENLPSAETFSYGHENDWIPISERLPEETGEYLTTTMYGDVFCDHWQSCNFDRTEIVIAWMPLPEPYKAGEQE